MSGPSSELVEISKLNGDFKRNYGKVIGAYLYLRSINAVAARTLGGLFSHFDWRNLVRASRLLLAACRMIARV